MAAKILKDEEEKKAKQAEKETQKRLKKQEKKQAKAEKEVKQTNGTKADSEETKETPAKKPSEEPPEQSASRSADKSEKAQKKDSLAQKAEIGASNGSQMSLRDQLLYRRLNGGANVGPLEPEVSKAPPRPANLDTFVPDSLKQPKETITSKVQFHLADKDIMYAFWDQLRFCQWSAKVRTIAYYSDSFILLGMVELSTVHYRNSLPSPLLNDTWRAIHRR